MVLYLLIGGNMGNREELLLLAKDKIGRYIGEVEQVSSIYETSPWGFDSENGFLNQALKVNTEMSLMEALDLCHRVETELGRVRGNGVGYVSRTMDVDIILADGMVVADTSITIPHPRMHLRRFVLVPLSEIAAGLIHPVFKKTIEELLGECEDPGEVFIFKKSSNE